MSAGKGGEQGHDGASHTALFAKTVKTFGWVQRGRQDKNLFGVEDEPISKGKKAQHGVDLLMTFTCPYTGSTRGVNIDAKRYQLSSAPKSKLQEMIDHTKKATQDLDSSLPTLREELRLPQDTFIDAGIVAWDCHKDWDEERALARIGQLREPGSTRKPITVFLMHNGILDRLSSVSQLKRGFSSLEFLYKPEQSPRWSPVLTPEMASSSIWPIQYVEHGEDSTNAGAIFFGPPDPFSATFLVPFFAYIGFLTRNSLTVYVMAPESEIADYQAAVEASLEQRGSLAKITCRQLPKTVYSS